ncbi:MAG: OmpA family protein [Spirochaetota bacterium]|nr:MAG: OmpA family protein [Spirochaetota bacterium]
MSKKLIYAFIVISLLLTPAIMIHAGTPPAVQKELDDCKAERTKLQEDNNKLRDERGTLNSTITRLEGEKRALERKIADLEKQIVAIDEEAVVKEIEARDMMIVSKTEYDRFHERESEITELRIEKEAREAEITQLKMDKQDLAYENRQLVSENQELTADIRQINIELTHLKAEKMRLEEEKEELEKTLAEYERIQRKSNAMMDVAIKRINEVLREEIETGKVRVYKGTMGIVLDVTGEYVFDMGSVNINSGGRVILSKIAGLLDELDGYLVGIIGNADSKPIVTPALKKRFGTNWELSAHRGAVVVRYLLGKSSISPRRMIVMGLGEYQPIDTNATNDGRGNNRRVDIVLLPIDVLAAIVVGAQIK